MIFSEVCAMDAKLEFIKFMVRSGVLTFGDFTAKSGRKTPYFVNPASTAPARSWRSWASTTRGA